MKKAYKPLTETIERVTTEYLLPAHWGNYFVNGDATGFEDDELERIEQWEHDHPDEYCIAIDDEIDYCQSGDDDELACDRRVYLFEKTQPFGED
jgi:hypothetical protein